MGRRNCWCWAVGRSCWRGAAVEFGGGDGPSTWRGGRRKGAPGGGGGGGGGGVAEERRNLGNPLILYTAEQEKWRGECRLILILILILESEFVKETH